MGCWKVGDKPTFFNGKNLMLKENQKSQHGFVRNLTSLCDDLLLLFFWLLFLVQLFSTNYASQGMQLQCKSNLKVVGIVCEPSSSRNKRKKFQVKANHQGPSNCTRLLQDFVKLLQDLLKSISVHVLVAFVCICCVCISPFYFFIFSI